MAVKKSIICFQIELRWAKDIQTIKTTIGKKKGNLTASSLPKVHTKYVYDDEEMRRKRKEFLIGELPSEYFIAFRVCDISELLFFQSIYSFRFQNGERCTFGERKQKNCTQLSCNSEDDAKGTEKNK